VGRLLADKLVRMALQGWDFGVRKGKILVKHPGADPDKNRFCAVIPLTCSRDVLERLDEADFWYRFNQLQGERA
tara:strand:+ start:578 stop:799 length:222 start_codon:yes stop_codon:yes gene_type:complete